MMQDNIGKITSRYYDNNSSFASKLGGVVGLFLNERYTLNFKKDTKMYDQIRTTVRMIAGQQQHRNRALEGESQFRIYDSTNLIIKNENVKRAILIALADTELQKILDAAIFDSKSVDHIIKDTGIPYTSAHKKIKWLIDEKFLVVDKIEIT